MKKNKLYFILLSSTLVAYIKVANAINFTECKLESLDSIPTSVPVRITFTDPNYLTTQSSFTLRGFTVKSNLPVIYNQDGTIKFSVALIKFNIPEGKELPDSISFNVAKDKLEIAPWFFTEESNMGDIEETDKFYTRANYVRQKLPEILEWRAQIKYIRYGYGEDSTTSRMAECQTHFDALVTDKMIGTLLSLDALHAMFPLL